MTLMTLTRAAFAPALAVLAVAAAVASLPAHAQAPAASPSDDPGKALLASACTVCHQIEVVTSQHHTAADWEDIIGKMVDRGATLTEAEQGQVRDYLAKAYGVEGAAAAPAAATDAAPQPAPDAPPPTPPEPPKPN